MVVKLDSLTIGRCTGAGAGAGVGAGVGFLLDSWGGGGGRDAGVGVDALVRFDGEGGTEDSWAWKRDCVDAGWKMGYELSCAGDFLGGAVGSSKLAMVGDRCGIWEGALGEPDAEP